MAKLVLTQTEQDEVPQLRCQIELMRRDFEKEILDVRRKLAGSEEREITLRSRIYELEHPAGPVDARRKALLDMYLEEEQAVTGWVKFEHIRSKLQISESQWSKFKRSLMAAHPGEYEERVRQVPRGKAGRRPKEFRRVISQSN
jgi:hypothetical protein